MHVCFIDDEESQIDRFRTFVRQQGAHVSFHDWSDDGTAFSAARPADRDLVVVLDLYFSGQLRGPMILQQLRQNAPDLPIIVLTQTSSVADWQNAIHEWGATDAFDKNSTRVETLWSKLEASVLATREQHRLLKEALNHASSSVPDLQFAGLRECDALLGVSSNMHVPALKAKSVALQGLLRHGLQQDLLPLSEVLSELDLTCSALFSAEGNVDRTLLQSWLLAVKHSADPSRIAKLGGVCLATLRHDDSLLTDFIRWQERRENSGSGPATAAVKKWPDEAPDASRTLASLRLAEASRQLGSADKEDLARASVGRLAARPPQMPTSEIESAFSELGERLVLDLLQVGDPTGKQMAPLLTQVLESRVQHGTTAIGPVIRSVDAVELLVRWSDPSALGPVQRLATEMALQLHLSGGKEVYRDRCLALARRSLPQVPDAAVTVLDLLSEVDSSTTIQVLADWLERSRAVGHHDVSSALAKWAAAHSGSVLRSPTNPSELQRVVRALVQAGEQTAAASYVIGTLEHGLRDLRIMRKRDLEEALADLRRVVEFARNELPATSGKQLEKLDKELTAVAAAAMKLPGVLAGKRLAVVAGTHGQVGPEGLQRYKAAIEDHLGAACDSVNAELDAQLDALSGSILGGRYQIVVNVLGSMSHAASGKVAVACERARERQHDVRLVSCPVTALGPRAVIRAIADQLALAAEETGERDAT